MASVLCQIMRVYMCLRVPVCTLNGTWAYVTYTKQTHAYTLHTSIQCYMKTVPDGQRMFLFTSVPREILLKIEF